MGEAPKCCGTDWFCPELSEGQVVQYELVTNRGKTSAENLRVS